MADIDALLGELTLEEKAQLTAGEGFFTTAPIERLGIPQIRLTDGPSGARGVEGFFGIGGPPSTSIVCGSAVGATWDPELATALGALVAREARDRGCRVLLAPTVNLHRSPLAGRNFECYSEDPFLSGRLATGYVQGVQSEGVIATVKHFVGNDAEFERGSMSSDIDERTLRELYLLPFEMAVRGGGALAIMAAYNRLNGRWLSQQPEYLMDILRGEWGFEGLVMTDWFATAVTEESLAAGLDLEMPGPGSRLGATVAAAVRDGRVKEADLDAAVRRLLGAFDRIGALDEPTPPIQNLPTREEDVSLLRRAAADAVVLLTNDGVLPLSPADLRRVAVIGPSAADPRTMGGGSSAVIPHGPPDLLGALAESFGPGVQLHHHIGAQVELNPRAVGSGLLPAPDGFAVDVFDGLEFAGEPIQQRHLDELRFFVARSLGQDWPAEDYSVRVRGTVVPSQSGAYQLALAQAGRARLRVEGELLLDGFAEPMPEGGTDFFGRISKDATAVLELTEGVPVALEVEYARIDTVLAGARVGFRLLDEEGLLASAAQAAGDADVAVVFVGTTDEWESEGRDRTTLALPGLQDELVRRVAAANPRTIVVVNAGAPVVMPWVDEVAAVMQCWFGGQEMPTALAEILVGSAEPGGRLPTTVPVRLEHSPSHGNFPGENGHVRYGEGLFMGYRGFEHRCIEPLFPFGHGLSYTEFALGEAVPSSTTVDTHGSVTVAVQVTNTGTRAGSTVVQAYVAPRQSRLARPLKELKAFSKVRLDPGESTVVELVLDERSFAYWDPSQPDYQDVIALLQPMFLEGAQRASVPRPAGWYVDPGEYDVLVGFSSADILAGCTLTVVEP
jgi:beta-glucosidase